jgi:transposase
MVPMPENIAPAKSIDEAMALYEQSAKSHNKILAEYLLLKEQNDWIQRQLFGTRSERFVPIPQEQQTLFSNEVGASNGYDVTVTPILDPAHKQKLHKRITAPKGHGWGVIPDHLERVDIHVPLSDEQKKGVAEKTLVQIREEITERIAIRPQSLYVKRFIRPIFAMTDSEGNKTIVTAPLPESPIEKGRADLSILIYLAVSKFVDHLPLDRIRKIFLRQGVRLQTSTLCDWLESLHDLLLPVYLAMADAVKKCDLVHTDDTVVRVVRSDKKRKTHKGRMWVYIGNGHSVYEYSPTRGGIHPSKFLLDFKGKLQADGYAGYNAVTERSTVLRVGCHAHARRYFEKALPHFPEAREMMIMYQDLFRIEQIATEENATIEIRRSIRQEKSKPLLMKMKEWMDLKLNSGVLPKSSLGVAIHYALGQWETLEVFLDDGNLPLSNNISERAMRGVVMGRNNYLFFGSEEAAKRGAVFYSVLHSCVCLGINPEVYLHDVIEKMETLSHKRILELTPAGWLAARPEYLKS